MIVSPTVLSLSFTLCRCLRPRLSSRTRGARPTAASRSVPLRLSLDLSFPPADSSLSAPPEIAFIRSHVKSFNFCENPALRLMHSAFSTDIARKPDMWPHFVLSKWEQANQILFTPLEAFRNISAEDRTPWEELVTEKVRSLPLFRPVGPVLIFTLSRTARKLFWRGSTTGDHYSQSVPQPVPSRDPTLEGAADGPLLSRKGYDWHTAHRVRLHNLTNSISGKVQVVVENSKRTLLGGDRQSLHLQTFDLGDLNSELMDVGLTRITQCDEKDGTCEWAHLEAQHLHPS